MNETLYSFFTSMPFCLFLFWWVILLLRRNTLSFRAHKHLSWFAFVMIFLSFCHATYFNGEETSWTRVIYVTSNLLMFPLLWIYTRALTEPGELKARDRWVLAPALLFGIILSIIVLSGGSAYAIDLPFRILFLLELVVSFIFILQRLTAFDRRVQNFYVDTEHKSLKDLRTLFIVLIPLSFLSFLMGVIGRSFFMENLLLIIPSVSFCVLVFGFFHIAFLLEYTAAEMAAAEPESPDAATEPDERAQLALMDRVRELMQSQRIYLTPGLKISDIAETLDTNRTYISACINRQTGMSFSDYVNGFRIRYAQDLMRRKDLDLTLTQIGIQSGFSGDTSFFRNFKKVTGQTPSGWLSAQ